MADAAPATPSPSRLARKLTTALAALLAAGVLLGPSAARAVDPFEIQVYDGTVGDPGQPGVELHANTVIDGVRTSEPPELPAHHQSHFTLEPAVAITRWWELGLYLQSAVLPDGGFTYAGTKLRTKFVAPPRAGRTGLHAHGRRPHARSSGAARAVPRERPRELPAVAGPRGG